MREKVSRELTGVTLSFAKDDQEFLAGRMFPPEIRPARRRDLHLDPYLIIHVCHLFLWLGWFAGEPFRLFGLTLAEYEYIGPEAQLSAIDLQIARFCLVVGAYWRKG